MDLPGICLPPGIGVSVPVSVQPSVPFNLPHGQSREFRSEPYRGCVPKMLKMVESEADELTEDQMFGAVLFAHDEFVAVIQLSRSWASQLVSRVGIESPETPKLLTPLGVSWKQQQQHHPSAVTKNFCLGGAVRSSPARQARKMCKFLAS